MLDPRLLGLANEVTLTVRSSGVWKQEEEEQEEEEHDQRGRG